MLPNAVQMMITIYTIEAAHDYSEHQNLVLTISNLRFLYRPTFLT